MTETLALPPKSTEGWLAGIFILVLAVGLTGWAALKTVARLSWYFQNVAAFLQDNSSLTLLGGPRGLATRLTLALLFLGAGLATRQHKHIAIDVVAQAFAASTRLRARQLGLLVAAAVCLASAVGFFDFLAIDAFGAASGASVLDKMTVSGRRLNQHFFIFRRQLALDLRMVPKVLRGEAIDNGLRAAEYNAWLAEADWASFFAQTPEPATERDTGVTPLVPALAGAPRGLLAKDLGLLVPFGLCWLAWRCVRAGFLNAPQVEPLAGPLNQSAAIGILVTLSILAGALAGPWASLTVALALIGVPLYAVLGLGAGACFVTHGNPLNRLAPKVLDEQFAGSSIPVAIVLFTALGFILAKSKAAERLVALSQSALGFLPGSLGLVCLAASAFFTALTGGSGVSIVAIGGLLLPALQRQSTSERFSLGLVTTGGSLGLLFPPSLAVLVFALAGSIDYVLAFQAALLPGLLVFAALSVLVVVHFRSANVEGAQRIAFDQHAAVSSLWAAKYELVLPLVLFGLLALGLTTLEETAALGLVYLLVSTVAFNQELSWRLIPNALGEAAALSGAVLLILMMANALMNFVIDARMPDALMQTLSAFGLSQRWQFLLALNAFLLGLGMVMDGVSAIVVAVPLVTPLAARFGLSPFHVASVVVLNLELAFCMPPLGLNLFIAAFRFQKPTLLVYRSVLPFVAVLALCLGVVTFVPWFSTALIEPHVQRLRAQAMAQGVAPREAWLLECVQADVLHPQPCSDADKLAFPAEKDGDEDEALLKQMLAP